MATTKACPNCRAAIATESRFCPQCGTAQAVSCGACGHTNPAASKFCAQCGAKLGEAANAAIASPPGATPLAGRHTAAERRQLTVMFCDLVGSTALSTQLDPEDLREIIAAYHKTTADVVGRFGGYVAKYMGDGVLVYFGYPEAHEADAENAIRAGLLLVDAVAQLFAAERRHQVRIGIATGLVVVGELVGTGEAQERNVVGETPNLAARLQAAAEPNTVVIAATTQRLAGHLFDYEPVEPAALKGFPEPVGAWRVLRERPMINHLEVLRAGALTPLIGREEEIELLMRRWQQIKEGEGRVVLLAGEPGIGKSRLAAALEAELKEEAHICLRYFCQAHTQGSVLQPILTHLAHEARFTRDDAAAEKRTKLARLLTRNAPDHSTDVELFAELLGLGGGRPVEAAARDPQRKRRRILAALIEQFEACARRGPLLILFEDAHWADPTSAELLTLAIERLQSLPILLIITFRNDYQPPWTGQPHVTALTLNRLSQRGRTMLVEHITGGKGLPPALLDQIVERTDGVPLFVEELTKAVLESEQLRQTGEQRAIEPSVRQMAIPSTLQDSLMARVDRLGSAREVLQIGAAIGREFSYEVLAAVAGLPDALLQDALARLTEAELVYVRGTPPAATYSFKHALIQDTAYSTMLRSHRAQLHSAIGLILEKRFADVAEGAPELLAQQFEWAGHDSKAIEYWRQAGDRDLRRFAMRESVAHYRNALRVIAAMPESPQRDDLELSVCLGLGLAQQIAMGPTDAEAGAHYGRALTLSSALPHRGRERFLATWGVWFYNTMKGNTAEAFELSENLVRIARELNNLDLLLEAHHARTPGYMRIPDFVAMKESAQEVIRLYDRERHRDHAYYFGGHDSRVCAHSFHALSLWGLGFPDQAREMARRSVEDARDLGHTFSLAHGLNMSGLTYLLLAEVETCRAIADELYPLAERNKFPWPLAQARFMRGWLACEGGNFDGGIGQMIAAADDAGAAVLRPVFLAMIVEQQMRSGDFAGATHMLDRADSEAHRNRFYQAETDRLRGELLLAQARGGDGSADALFRQAMKRASEQSCRPIVLRAAASLARLLHAKGCTEEARAVLAPAYDAFSEGFATRDLQAAKALLAELG